MNSNKFLKAGFVAALMSVPFHAQATSGQAGLDACAEAMIADMAAAQGAPMVYNLDPSNTRIKGSLKMREIIHLDAKDPNSDEVVARVDCVVNSRAEVKELIRVPLEAPDARYRATTYN